MRAFFWLVPASCLLFLTAGCELIVDFDRGKIVADSGARPDTFVPSDSGDEDAGEEEDAGPDEDGGAEEDAGPIDAGPDEDAGPVDAGPVDAGPDAGPTMVCGNGTMEGTEACDDGNTTSEANCPYGTMTCMLCNATCAMVLSLTGAYCGDSTMNGPEDCDSGGVDSATCDADCTDVECGDGIENTPAGEECDDGDTTPGDGCSATCTIEVADGG